MLPYFKFTPVHVYQKMIKKRSTTLKK